MRRHPSRPASIYRPDSEIENISWKVQRFIRSLRAPFYMMAPEWVAFYRAMANARLPRNFFTMASPIRDGEK